VPPPPTERFFTIASRWGQVSICYLLGLDWNIPGRFQELRAQEKVAQELRKAAESAIAKPFWHVKANAAMTPDRQFPRAAVVRRHLHLPEFAGPASRSA
jgi:hypothetical protein